MAPPTLNMSDIFTIYTNYEPSSVKIWEIVRSYDPIEFAKFLYVLENVTKSRKRLAIHINNQQLATFSTINRNAQNQINHTTNKRIKLTTNSQDNDFGINSNDGCSFLDNHDDANKNELIIKLKNFKTLRIERCIDYYTFDNEMFTRRQNYKDSNENNHNGTFDDHDDFDQYTIFGNATNDDNNNNGSEDNGNIYEKLNNENELFKYNQNSAKTSNILINMNDGAMVNSEITIFWNRNNGNKFTQQLNMKYTQEYNYKNTNISYNLNNIDSIEQQNNSQDINITTIMNKLRNGNNNMSYVFEKILNHNLGTYEYSSLLSNIQYLLFNDNFQMNRNDINGKQNNQSIVEQFLQFYKNLSFSQTVDNDPRNFHFLVIPKARQYPTVELNRWMAKENLILRRQSSENKNVTMVSSKYIYQPYFHGLHLIVYSSPTETKCYNRFGDLYPNFAYTIRSKEPCTFEAIVLPTDAYKNTRSWRYWQYRHGWLMYIVDVYRYKQTILLSTPFEKRIAYAKYIANGVEIHLIPEHLSTINGIYKQYKKNRDIYDSIIGVYKRNCKHILCEKTLHQSIIEWDSKQNETIASIQNQNKFIDHHRNSYSLFNLLYTFDILNLEVVSLNNNCNLDCLHMNLEMADYRVLCIGYGHTEEYIYLCRYDRRCHQFVHAATLERLSYESCTLTYKPDKIYVINNKILPQGVLYLRVYFDVNLNVIGYDTKITDGRYKLPYDNILYKQSTL
ncbi:GrBNV_gp48-like protein [Drosophila innubila nudivirus]|uniref:GrBNV_gp48-like protein n=1 Tax=Drosophila innubila nudivirus TaxID=2057187 RepID=A0A2H4UXA6_9VIRU|nr:GrBNV_gp48-like protein [Drosophila innubila nudivirus]ATZ81551.1 GrBNV_gp48-like protein [Drosophila innubila nudivirus]